MGWQKPETWRGKCASRKQAGLRGETVNCWPVGVQGFACCGRGHKQAWGPEFPWASPLSPRTLQKEAGTGFGQAEWEASEGRVAIGWLSLSWDHRGELGQAWPFISLL